MKKPSWILPRETLDDLPDSELHLPDTTSSETSSSSRLDILRFIQSVIMDLCLTRLQEELVDYLRRAEALFRQIDYILSHGHSSSRTRSLRATDPSAGGSSSGVSLNVLEKRPTLLQAKNPH